MPSIKIFTVIAALTFSSQAAFADCNEFVAFNEEGNWVEDIHARVDDALSCEEWPLDFDKTRFTYAQRHIVYSAVSDQRPDEALQIALSYIDAAVARHERALVRLGPAGLITDEGIFVFDLKTRIGQLEFIAADAESTQHNCDENQSLNALLLRQHNEIDAKVEQHAAGAEESRLWVEQLLRDLSLEEWQQRYPDVTSIDDVRNHPYIRTRLEPDVNAYLLEQLNRVYFRALNHSATAEGSTVRLCLVEAFEAIPEVAELTPAQRFWQFQGISKFAYRLRNDL